MITEPEHAAQSVIALRSGLFLSAELELRAFGRSSSALSRSRVSRRCCDCLRDIAKRLCRAARARTHAPRLCVELRNTKSMALQESPQNWSASPRRDRASLRPIVCETNAAKLIPVARAMLHRHD